MKSKKYKNNELDLGVFVWYNRLSLKGEKYENLCSKFMEK